MAQKVALDELQVGLQHQTKEVKEKLGEYEGKRNAIQVCFRCFFYSLIFRF
jgi:hypothetical protein